MKARFVGGPIDGDRIGVPEGQKKVLLCRNNIVTIPESHVEGEVMIYGEYVLVSDGVYRWVGWDDER